MSSILLVAYFFPPAADTGSHRPATMAKYLSRLGHDVTVLTTNAYGEGGEPDGVQVVRTADLQLLRARLTGAKQARSTFGSDVHASKAHPLAKLFVPDSSIVAWVPFALARALLLARERRFDCVLTTSGPESTHMIGWALKQRGAAWVADVRDGWNFEPLRVEWPTRVQGRLDHWLERRLMRAADVVTTVSEPLVEDFQSRLGANAALVPNGWDPELFERADGEPGVKLDPDRLSIVYTGRFATYSRDPGGLIEALRGIATEEPELAARLEFVFAGPYTEAEHALLAEDLGPLRIRVLGSLPRQGALALQQEADALLLVASERRRQSATVKLFEYLGAGRPVLALAAGTEAGRIVEEAGAGIVASASDPAAARAALRRLVEGQAPVAPEEARRAYAYPAIAERMAAQIEAAIAARRT